MTTVVIIASGNSLVREDVDYLRGRARVLAVSDNYRIAPFAEWIYSSCKQWWDVHLREVLATTSADLWTRDPAAQEAYGLNLLPHRVDSEGIEEDSCAGNCSGEHAIHLAYHLGATKIVLLGFDMGATGQGHWFGKHPKPLANGADFKTMRKSFPRLAADLRDRGVEVLNATRETALDCFPRVTLAEAL